MSGELSNADYVEYFDDLLVRVELIQQIVALGRDIYIADIQRQASVERHFQIIGDIIKIIPTEILSMRPEIEWRKVAKFRDLLVHHYKRVDSEEVWQSAESDLPKLKLAILALREELYSTD